jgi:hypothetical protein
MLLENKYAVIYRWGEYIGGVVAQTFANLTSEMSPSYITHVSITTQRQRKAA